MQKANQNIPPTEPTKTLFQRSSPIIKAIFSVISFAIVCAYFEVIPYIISSEVRRAGNIHKAIWCISFSIVSYGLTYFHYCVRPRPSQRISVERWYTVSPLIVWMIVIGHVCGLFFLVCALWPQYEIVSLVIVGLFAFSALNIIQFSPI